ncbi:EamA family transporter [Paenibacillus sp. FSL W8-0426]|uniref:EamA family transporter n=1 Tax=Paenibacillus sp. FSL W8-0426 TaxID=2921714 RepID=UPI0030DB902A
MKFELTKSYVFLFFSILSQSTASLFSKFAADAVGEGHILLVVTNSYYILSLVFLFFQAIFWQYTLRDLDLSFAYPLTALNNIIIVAFSYFLFHEEVTFNNLIGVLIIMTGIIILNIKSAKQ